MQFHLAAGAAEKLNRRKSFPQLQSRLKSVKIFPLSSTARGTPIKNISLPKTQACFVAVITASSVTVVRVNNAAVLAAGC
ncbi:MAG: hypothetical protein ACYTHJ_21485 [Planctomycetota bacterium]|jgi:hypothetical protein